MPSDWQRSIVGPVKFRLPALLALAVLVTACSDPDDPSPPLPPDPGYVGEFIIARVVTYVPGSSPSVFIFAEASFDESALPGAAALDAGAAAGMDRTESNIDINLIRREFLGDIFYQRDPDGDPLPENDFEYEATYDVWVEGSQVDKGVPSFATDDTLATPGSLTVTAPDLTQLLQVDGTADIDLTWTSGGSPADRVVAVLIVSDGITATQTAVGGDDDGQLTIPASTFQALGDGDGSLTFYRVIEQTFNLPGGGTATARGLVGETGLLRVSLM